jgi:hypothetical protein
MRVLGSSNHSPLAQISRGEHTDQRLVEEGAGRAEAVEAGHHPDETPRLGFVLLLEEAAALPHMVRRQPGKMFEGGPIFVRREFPRLLQNVKLIV